MKPYKKLTFKQALIVLGHGEQIQSAPDRQGGLITISVDENNDFDLENTGFMDLYDFSDEQWYVELHVYENIFVEGR